MTVTGSVRARSGVLHLETVVERRPDGTVYARSPVPLGPYPARITERLEHWAAQAADRPFLIQRDDRGRWAGVTYADALRRVRAVAQALIDRRLGAERPVVILSGNSLEHGLLALAAMYCGVPYAPLAPSYSLLSRDCTTLKTLWASLKPGLVFASQGPAFERALAHVLDDRTELVTVAAPSSLRATPFGELESTAVTPAVDAAHVQVDRDAVAKILYTSGSTGQPKGVINTQRMLCANQEMLRTVLPLLAESPPVLCDWLPWNHTFGGNHNFGLVLYNGGTLYIDEGKPTPYAFGVTLANLREVPITAYFNVPRGYELLVPRLGGDPRFRTHFFGNLRMLFCAAAALRQQVADDLQAMAVDGSGARIPLVTGLGATETAPFALCAGDATFTGGRIGVPVPGVELKLAPVGQKLEGRLRGPNVTPGYWRNPPLTDDAFDDEGFYRLGDALSFFDPADPQQGFVFEGRLAEDFKLSTGTWVRVGRLRARFLAHFGDLVQDAVIAAPDRDFVAALVFPNLEACRALCADGTPDARDLLGRAEVRQRFAERLSTFAAQNPGSSAAVERAILLEDPPSIDAFELTDKGSVNQKAVLACRSALVDKLYDDGAHRSWIAASRGRTIGSGDQH